MNCPVCNLPLLKIDSAILCPSKHGTLVTGAFLRDIEDTKLEDIVHTAHNSTNPENVVTCPKCLSEMHKVNYNHTGIMIDACTNCHYRWLDSGEISKIKNFKPKFKAEDLLFLDDIAEKTKTLETSNPTDQNSKIPLYNAIRVASSGDSRRTIGALSGMAFYGIITGMIKSKLLRIIIPLLLIFSALVIYYISSSFK